MKSCVIFAVSIFNQNKLHVLIEFLDTFKKNYYDCDLYVGINYGCCSEVEEIINSFNLKARTYRIVNENLYCSSDASAYQAALNILRQSKQSYDLYWFAHTKGGVNDRPYERRLYLSELFGNRFHIEEMFSKFPHLGSYALRGVSGGAAGDDWAIYNKDHDIQICSNIITKFMPYTHVNWSYIETMYVIANKPIQTFLDNTTDAFYEIKIKEDNRWYFEVIFPWIVSRCGYFPFVKQQECFFGTFGSMKKITQDWIEKNNLIQLKEYLYI